MACPLVGAPKRYIKIIKEMKIKNPEQEWIRESEREKMTQKINFQITYFLGWQKLYIFQKR